MEYLKIESDKELQERQKIEAIDLELWQGEHELLYNLEKGQMEEFVMRRGEESYIMPFFLWSCELSISRHTS
jgi:hypothetical protein